MSKGRNQRRVGRNWGAVCIFTPHNTQMIVYIGLEVGIDVILPRQNKSFLVRIIAPPFLFFPPTSKKLLKKYRAALSLRLYSPVPCAIGNMRASAFLSIRPVAAYCCSGVRQIEEWEEREWGGQRWRRGQRCELSSPQMSDVIKYGHG